MAEYVHDMNYGGLRKILHHDLEEWNTTWTPSSPEVAGVISVDLSRMHRIPSTGRAFLPKYVDLEAVDLTVIKHLTELGDRFLYDCRTLLMVELDVFTNPLTRIGSHFLCRCSGILVLDLKALSIVTFVGACFLYGCTTLTALDLRPLSNVLSIGDYFLYDLHKIQELDLMPLSKIGVMPSHFLRSCKSLRAVDTTFMRNICRIGDCFLMDCSSITEIELRNLSNVGVIGNNFLSGCFGLKRLDLRCLMSVQKVGEFFLHDCTGLEQIIVGDDQKHVLAAVERSGHFENIVVAPAHPMAQALRERLVALESKITNITSDMLQSKEDLQGAQALLSAKANEWTAGRSEVDKLREKLAEREAKFKEVDDSRTAIYNAFMPLRKGVLAIRDELRHTACVEPTGLGEAALTMEVRALIRSTHTPNNDGGRAYPVTGPDGMVVTI